MASDIRRFHRYRTVWISDVHLGTRGCNADMLLAFLDAVETDSLYLVGDIVDGWRLKRSWFWPESHSAVMHAILRKARHGTRVVYVPGNHDEMARDYAGVQLGGIEIHEAPIHAGADGRRFLVLHGDQFDGVVTCARWLALLGDWAYDSVLRANIAFNLVRRRLGLGYWSLANFLKRRVKNAVQYVCDFEAAVAEEGRRQKVDGVICGHIHFPQLREIDGIVYANDGDWVESCTALVEHPDGRLAILDWTAAPAPPVADPAERMAA